MRVFGKFCVTLQANYDEMKKKDVQNRYIEGFGILTIMLALVRCAFPGVAGSLVGNAPINDSIQITRHVVEQLTESQKDFKKCHRILSVRNYDEAFPDTNATQLTAARRWGVSPVRDRQDAEERKRELVYVAASPYYHVDPLTQSIPYLVPRAAVLLNDIGVAFFDSLQMKGVPLHRFIITSVLRTQSDVVKLRRFNPNATENSCHLYGTTVDIAYNRYKTVQAPEGASRRRVNDDTLKWVLSEVLRDMREGGRCHVKYEKKQSCFHLTVR